jgi:hypothetical protein
MTVILSRTATGILYGHNTGAYRRFCDWYSLPSLTIRSIVSICDGHTGHFNVRREPTIKAEMPDFDPNLTPFGLGFTVLRSQAVILCR